MAERAWSQVWLVLRGGTTSFLVWMEWLLLPSALGCLAQSPCAGAACKGLSSGATGNQVMISSGPALVSLSGPRPPVAAGSGQMPHRL